jgi:hypothetical protein
MSPNHHAMLPSSHAASSKSPTNVFHYNYILALRTKPVLASLETAASKAPKAIEEPANI